MRFKNLIQSILVLILFLATIFGCTAPQITPEKSEAPQPADLTEPPETQPDQKSIMSAKLDQLITLEDITTFSETLGIVGWSLDDEIIGEYRVCRMFRGKSWSVSTNLAVNCIWQMRPGITFPELVDWLIDVNLLNASAKTVVSGYEYDGEFGLYAWLGSNGHSVYDGYLLKDDFLYWAEVDVGTPGGLSPETLFESEYGPPIDAFLNKVLITNLSREK
jgi:hypothetical protein